ncbi:hypothetical protein NL108_016776 [Boleophthalmus pectinirostris]|nr:hypothetical protein NL108_016776 [Boleophthalmus pectinirostris]
MNGQCGAGVKCPDCREIRLRRLVQIIQIKDSGLRTEDCSSHRSLQVTPDLYLFIYLLLTWDSPSFEPCVPCPGRFIKKTNTDLSQFYTRNAPRFSILDQSDPQQH